MNSQVATTLQNRTFDELKLGDSATIERVLTNQDIQVFALVSGDVNPQHLDPEYAADTPFQGVIAHGMWGASVISAVLGTKLPGPGTIYLGQSLQFRAPVRVGDKVTVTVKVSELEPEKRRVTLECTCVLPDGTVAIKGEAKVLAPKESIEYVRDALPEIRMTDSNDVGLRSVLSQTRDMEPISVAVAHPCCEVSLRSALDAKKAGLITPILVAPKDRLVAVAETIGASLDGVEIVDVPHSHAAAMKVAEIILKGEAEAIMKGSLHTDELMAAIVGNAGLRTKRRVSHCYLMQTPQYSRPFIITDAAINIAPNLDQKADIIRNAIDLSHAIGVAKPKVAILAATETVAGNMPATLDAAALCKMADRGQITGAILDGPLAFDNAVSKAAAHLKGIESDVAGSADILVAPDLEAGNMLAKQLMYMGDAASAGIVLGARVPIILTSRADSYEARMSSCALALMLAQHYRTNPI